MLPIVRIRADVHYLRVTTRPTPTAGRSSEPPLWSLVTAMASGAAITLVLALAIAVGQQDGPPRAAPGDIFNHPAQEDPLPDSAEVSLPWQRISVAVGEPRAELPEILGSPPNVARQEGNTFVRVDARPVEDGLVAYAVTTRHRQVDVRLVLTADGREYPLSGPGGLNFDPNDLRAENGGTRWVAVAGHPTDLEVKVLVNGREQTVGGDGSVTTRDTSGLAALPSPEELAERDPVDCGSPRRVDESPLRFDYPDRVTCTMQLALRTPFVDGLGWAPAGREYLVVQVHTARLHLEDREGDEWASTVRLNGRIGDVHPVSGPVDVKDLNRGLVLFPAPGDPAQLIFTVPAGRSTKDLTLRLDVDAEPKDPFAREHEQVRLEWTIPAREMP